MSRDTQIINAGDLNLSAQEVITVKPGSLYHLIWFVIFTLIFLFAVSCFAAHFLYDFISFPQQTPEFIVDFYKGMDEGEVPYVSGFSATFLLLFVLIARSMYVKSLKSEGWLMKATAKGLYIQFRSYLNQHLDKSHDTVIFVPAEQVSWIREVRYTKVSKTSDGNSYQFMKAVEIQVRRVETEEVAAAISAEKTRKVSGVKWQDHPVDLDDRILRVNFTGMSPSAAKFVQTMRRWYMTQDMKKLGKIEGEALNLDLSPNKNDDHGYTEEDIISALNAGNTIEAIKRARLVHGIGLKAAKEYVDRL